MKSIELKFGKENVQGVDVGFSTLDLLKVAVNNITKEGGLGVQEMSQRLRLLDILNKYSEFELGNKQVNSSLLEIKKQIELEDADFEKLKDLFNNVKWTVISRFIVDLSEEFNK